MATQGIERKRVNPYVSIVSSGGKPIPFVNTGGKSIQPKVFVFATVRTQGDPWE